MALPVESPFSILVVDDEADNRTILKSQLEKVPHASLTVDTACDGDEALKKLRDGIFDLVFLDYRLPPTDGLDILDKIRQHHPKTAVVMTTAAGSEQVAVSAMKKGAMDYLVHKDLRAADLGQLLRRVAEIRNLVNQNMELRQVNQMKNEFIANVSHELRTPLTVVIGYANTMHDGSLGPMNEPQQKALTAIVERAEGLLLTLNNILRIREVHEGRKPLLLKPVDLRALVEAQLARASKEVRRKKLAVTSDLGSHPLWVLAEEEKLGDVVDNLLSNATKFSPALGSLRVALAVVGGKASLSISDQGPGVPPELMPHVFERFFAANQGPTREYPGLGLGLPLSKEIIDQHGGRIWLESQGAGSGTTAHMELLICAVDAPPAVVEGAETMRKKRVLIVEDNPDLVEVLMLFLATVSRNLSIATAHSGFEALEKIKDETPNLVILDVMMPGMDGFEVLARLRRLPDAERVPVMVLTGYSDAVERARDAGAQEVLLKPFEKNVFVKKVLQLLQDAPRLSRPTVVVLCGGRSAERFVSTVSAQCVIANLDPRRFRARLVHIGVDGSWAEIPPRRLLAETTEALHAGAAALRRLRAGAKKLDPWALLNSLGEEDCVFPVLHGPMGEDGTIQGMLEIAEVPYVGCGVLGSAAGMDKEATKRVAASAGLPQVPWAVARTPREAAAAARRLGFPVFIKPARMGSSVGVVKVKRASEIPAALREALRYDDKALVEKGIPAREIETAVLGDPWARPGDRFELKASMVAEIVPNAEFYDYKAKYLDPEGARALVPAPLPAKTAARVRTLALAAFRALDLYGLARVDFFLHKRTGAVYFNEPNTLPGFTPASMYPRLWRESGIPTRRLVETLVALAHRRARARRRLSADPIRK